MIQTRCSSCGGNFPVEEAYQGQHARCPYCGQMTLAVPAARAAVVQPPQAMVNAMNLSTVILNWSLTAVVFVMAVLALAWLFLFGACAVSIMGN